MENIMKEMLVSGLQAKVDNETFIKRVAYLLDDNALEILCIGVPVMILDYDKDKMKDIVHRRDSRVIEINNAYLTSDPNLPVRIEYTSEVVRYFANREEADIAAREGNRYAGSCDLSESKPIRHMIHYTDTIAITIDQANKCCVFNRI